MGFENNMKKKILFINMPIREHAPPNNAPLGVLSLATHLNSKGHNAGILDLNVYRPLPTEEELKKLLIEKISDQYIIGLSGLITTLKYQEIVAKIIRNQFPNVYIVSGGGLATDIKEKLFEWIPELNAICIGEGESIIEEIPHGEKAVLCGPSPRNLDKFLLDYSLIDVEKYINNPIWGSDAQNSSVTPFRTRRSLSTVSSRGCPFNCSFCDKEATGGNNYRMRSADSLLQEMKYLVSEYNIDFLGYIDDNMILNTRRLEDLLILIQKEDLYLQWGAHARLDDINKNKAKLISDLNGIYLGFGGESANKEVLKRMNKGLKSSDDYYYNGHVFPKIYIDTLENCKEFGIHPNLTWMIGYPDETLEQLKGTIAFILFMEEKGYVERKYNNRSLFIATAYPNTELFNETIVQKKLLKAFKTFKEYVYSLDDATKMIINNNILLNYSKIPDSLFIEIKEYIERDEIERILDLK